MIHSIIILCLTFSIIWCVHSIFYEASVNVNTQRQNSYQFKKIKTKIICKLLGLATLNCSVFVYGSVFCFAYCFG